MIWLATNFRTTSPYHIPPCCSERNQFPIEFVVVSPPKPHLKASLPSNYSLAEVSLHYDMDDKLHLKAF